jgi:hypothetical protein
MERLYMRRELYFSIMLDRSSFGPLIVASTKGGTSIEDVAHRTPEAIIKVSADGLRCREWRRWLLFHNRMYSLCIDACGHQDRRHGCAAGQAR